MGSTRVFVGGYEVVVAATAKSQLSKLFDSLNRRLEADQLPHAFREIDRAWRTLPEHRGTLAPIYGRLLVREGKKWAAAIQVLSRALNDAPTPELEADLVEAFSASRQSQAAHSRLAAALRRFAIVPESPLARRASQIIRDSAGAMRGWAGITPDLQLYAEASAESRGAIRFELRSEDGALIAAHDAPVLPDARAITRFTIPRKHRRHPFRITANGEPLLGGHLSVPKQFEVDGRASVRRGVVTGWVRLGWNPGTPVDLLIHDQHDHSVRLQAKEALPQSRWQFQLDARKAGLEGGRFEISVLLPDGSRQRLPDSPLLSESEARASLRAIAPRQPRASEVRARARHSRADRPPVSVIIPVYRDRAATLACIEAVCMTVAGVAAGIIVVDDASPDPGLVSDLDVLAASKRITLIRHRTNRGFSAGVNRAMALQDGHDVVLINSDAVVFHDWLNRLRDAAYSGPRIGTATPFADDDSIAGYREAGGGTIASAEILDRYASTVNRGVTKKIPVGVGFCLYIRRDCLRQVGGFDEAVFGPGYGEEADFCMRARKKGWEHVLAADIFVHHAGGGSFGSRRAALFDRSQRLLNLRHPGYDRAVARFASKDPLHPCRRRLDEERLRSFQGRMVLIVTVARTGGIDRIIAERCRQIRMEGRLPLLLRPLTIDDAESCILRCEEMGLADLHFENDRELSSLLILLESLPIDAVELHHFLGLDPRLVAAVQQLGVPYDAYVHDYAWICPRITLIDGSDMYCGEPAVSVCERCIRRNGSVLFETISVRALRQRSRQWLSAARRVIAPSQDTADRLRRYMPGLAIDVVPHEIFLVRAPRPPEPEPNVTRVAVLGAIGLHKGYKILLECARDAVARKLNLEFVLIGYTEDDARLVKTGKIFVTGEYADGEIGQLLQRERPSAIFLPSVWPETWSFTLSHAIASGLPVVAFDLGAIAERLRAAGVGSLLPLGLPAGAINDHLMAAGRG